GELVEAVPLLPRPVGLASRMQGDRARREVEAASRGGDERRRQRIAPSELTRERLHARGVAVAHPSRAIEHQVAIRTDARPLVRGPDAERRDVVALAVETDDVGLAAAAPRA